MWITARKWAVWAVINNLTFLQTSQQTKPSTRSSAVAARALGEVALSKEWLVFPQKQLHPSRAVLEALPSQHTDLPSRSLGFLLLCAFGPILQLASRSTASPAGCHKLRLFSHLAQPLQPPAPGPALHTHGRSASAPRAAWVGVEHCRELITHTSKFQFAHSPLVEYCYL